MLTINVRSIYCIYRIYTVMTLNTVGKEVIMRIVISNSSGISIYEQIKEGIKS